MTIAFVITSVAVQSHVIKDSKDDLIQPQANKQVAKRATDYINNYNYGTQNGWPGNGASDQRPMPIHGGPHHGGPHHGGPHHGGQHHGVHSGPCHGGPNCYSDPYPVPYPGSPNAVYGPHSDASYPSYITIDRKQTIYPGSGYQRIIYPGSGYGGHTSYQPSHGGYSSGGLSYGDRITIG